MDDFLKQFQGSVPSRSDPAFEKRVIAQLLAYRAKFEPINVALRAMPPNIPAENIPSLIFFNCSF